MTKRLLFGWVFLLLVTPCWSGYEPTPEKDFVARTIDETVRDAKRNRDLPVRVYLPTEMKAAPVILFSHGLGGSSKNNPYLGHAWASRGYVVVFVQHPGSDEQVWKDVPATGRLAALRKAASASNLLLRARDIPAVLDELERWNADKKHALGGRLDLQRVGMSGHSFGAQTTQAVSGQSFPLVQFTDKRIKAALMMSPNAPERGDPKSAFKGVTIPWMLMTGTRDTAAVGNATVESRLAVFPALPAGDKYELVLDRAEHSAFGDRPLPGDKEKRNPNHHRAILALSIAFWDAHLKADDAAKKWLQGDAPRKVLEKADRWQHK
jgi:predicted dienelactone hydrolase